MLQFSVVMLVAILRSLTCVLTEQTFSEHSKSIKSFVRYLTEHESKYQVIFLLDPNANDKIEDFLQNVIRTVPSVALNFNQMTQFRSDSQILPDNSRQTTLFILFSFGDSLNKTLLPTFEFLVNITLENVRPKCLIVHQTSVHKKYQTILQELWRKKFLDVTILQLLEIKQANNFGAKKRIATLHHYNPYSKIFTSSKQWSSFDWFPDKNKNFHRYELKKVSFGLMTGSKDLMELFKILSEKLNFFMDFGKKFDERSGGLSCQDARGIYRHLLDDRAHFLLHHYSYKHYCNRTIFRRSRILHLEEVFALVPKSSAHFTIETISWKFFAPFLGNLMAIICLYIILLLMKFNRTIWNPINILQILLGSDFTIVPSCLREKIVFIFILFSSIIYTSYIFTLFTEMQMKENSVDEISSAQELIDSNLSVYTNHFLFSSSDFRSEAAYEIWHNKSLAVSKVEHGLKKCLEQIAEYKNISCALSRRMVFHEIEKYRKKFMKLNMKLLEEPLRHFAYIFWMAPGAPFGDAIDREMLKYIDFGLMAKLELYFSKLEIPSYLESPDVNGSLNLLERMLLLLAVGYLFSTLAFLMEVFTLCIKKCKVHRFSKFKINWSKYFLKK